MATFLTRARMVALFLCVLFANASFAQDDWVTVAFYMEDPISERVAPAVDAYISRWLDPLTWETFERDFTPARDAQVAQVEAENRARIRAAQRFLEDDITRRGDGTSTWYPAWIPLALAKGNKAQGQAADSLFKNILSIEGPKFSVGPKAGQPQTLREFFENQGLEPDGVDDDGKQKYRRCIQGRERCRDKEFSEFADLVADHLNPAVNIISFRVKARRTDIPPPPPIGEVTFAGEQDGGPAEKDIDGTPDPPQTFAEFDYTSIELLQPAVHDPNDYVIDTSPYFIPAAKPNASTEASSWGNIKAIFADD